MANPPNCKSLGLWEETGAPGGNPRTDTGRVRQGERETGRHSASLSTPDTLCSPLFHSLSLSHPVFSSLCRQLSVLLFPPLSPPVTFSLSPLALSLPRQFVPLSLNALSHSPSLSYSPISISLPLSSYRIPSLSLSLSPLSLSLPFSATSLPPSLSHSSHVSPSSLSLAVALFSST